MADPKKPEDEEAGETVTLENQTSDVEENEDGSAVVTLDNTEQSRAATKHFTNIVDDVDQKDLSDVVTDLLDKIEKDKQAREKRDKLYEEGLRRTGMGDDAPGGAKFPGASKTVHPMLIEACVDFSARAMKELFPPAGPVKSKIIGKMQPEKLRKAERKAAFMNWQLTEQMPEARGELEQLTTQLPLGGGQYIKVLWDRARRRPEFEFVPIDMVYLPFAATNFYSAERRTHVIPLTKAAYLKKVRAGAYIDVDLPSDPGAIEQSKAQVANDKIEGRTQSSYNEDGLRMVFEVSLSLDLEDEGEFRPYLLTVDKSSQKALALYRNWDEEDENYEALDWMVEFPFIPWRGAYPIGLTHLIGTLSGAATGALRALLDSAHIQNIPTAIKLKGAGDAQSLNLQPTEVAELDGGGLADDIRKLIMPMPFPGPSATLFQLLGFLIDAGKGVVQTSFEKLSDQNANAPVGTTMALIEQGMVVFSSIHSRLHNSMARLFRIMHRLNRDYLTVEDLKAMNHGMEVKPADFDGELDVIPVSDPSIFSDTQRFAQVQALMQRATLMPQMYDARKVEEMFLRLMKVSDDVLMPKPGEDNMDPVSENVAAALGRPVYVLPKQDHMAHLKAHMSFATSPLFGANPVIARTYLMPMVGHVRDHLLNYYLVEAHEAVSQAQEKKMIGADASEEVRMIAKVQQLIEQELGQFAQLLPAMAQEAQKYAPPQLPQDPSLQVAQMNAQQKDKELAQKAQITQATEAQDAALEQQKLADRERDRQARLAETQLRETAEDNRTQEELSARMAMNREDNSTAIQLATAEIATGEKFSVSTGTGINPGTR